MTQNGKKKRKKVASPAETLLKFQIQNFNSKTSQGAYSSKEVYI